MSEAVTTKTMNRWIPVFAGIAIQLCLGTAYIWGVFQPQVTKLLGWKNADAALSYSILLGMLTIGSTLGGLFERKFGAKPVVLTGGIILGLGFMLAKFAWAAAPWWMWLTYGVLGGLGMGIVYTTIIACCQRWFPDKRGMITGLIVSALGFGGLIFTPIAQSLIASVGVLSTFLWLGVIFIVVCTIGSFFIHNPPEGFKPEGWNPPAPKAGAHITQSFTPKEVLKTPQYYLITLTLMVACAAGSMVIPFAKVLGVQKGLTDVAATSGVMIISMFNSFGRLFWGWTSDKLGRKNTLTILLTLTVISILMIGSMQQYMVLVLIALVGFSYGGYLGVFPALTADYFGVKHVSTNYGMVLFGFGAGAIAASYIAGYYKDVLKDFNQAFIIAAIAAAVGLVILFFIKPPAAKKEV